MNERMEDVEVEREENNGDGGGHCLRGDEGGVGRRGGSWENLSRDPQNRHGLAC